MTDRTTVASPALGSAAERRASAPWELVRVVVTALAFVVPLAAADGGYRPVAWSWATLGACWLALLVLVLANVERPGSLERVTLGALLAFMGWICVSLLWTSSATRTVLEAERALLYTATLAMALLLVRRRTIGSLLAGTWAAVALVALYALSTRLLPERVGTFDPLAGYRLAAPVGYWNALGVVCAMGGLLGFGLAVRGPFALRPIAAASLVVVLPTLYFTFGRGPWLALGCGVVAALVLDPRRLGLATAMLVLVPWVAAGVWLASRSEGLVRRDAPLALASHDGHRLAWILVLLAAGAAVSACALALAERRVRVGSSFRVAYACALLLVLVAGLVGVFGRYGTPATLVRKGVDAFRVPVPAEGVNLNERLFDLSGNGRDAEWRVAWRVARTEPLLGSGAGTFEQRWLRLRDVPFHARDAHNLYLETLAELGPVGLALLALALLMPLVAAVVARHRPLVPVAAAAYVAFLVHAAVDWDWELPVVTLTALLCATSLLAAARADAGSWAGRARNGAVAGALAVGAVALLGVVANGALAASERAISSRDWSAAASDARKARTWAPWSSDPWRRLGEAQAGLGDLVAARSSFRHAIAKDPGDWSLWYDLATVTSGREQTRALAEAARRNPLGSEVEQLRLEIGS